jgi:uroporphyrinogen-III synthase
MSSTKVDTLAGRTVVITRARAQVKELASLLEEAGAKVLACPTIEIVPLEDLHELDAALARSFDVVLLGSKNAAEILFSRSADLLDRVHSSVFACVGAKTAAFVREHTPAQIVSPADYNAEALLAALENELGALAGKRILFPRAPEGREVLIEALAARGARVEAIAVYRIAGAAQPTAELVAELEKADDFTFLSGETLRAFLALVPHGAAMLARARVAVIGPIAAARAAELGVRVDVQPKSATIEALVEALSIC